MENTPTIGSINKVGMDAYMARQAILNKNWDDCSVEEKLEKVKEELIQLGHMSYSINNISLDVQKLKDHTHAEGKVVIPLNSTAFNGLASPSGGASRKNNLS